MSDALNNSSTGGASDPAANSANASAASAAAGGPQVDDWVDRVARKFLRHELSFRRWRRFRKNKMASVSVVVFVVLSFFSFTAEIWANRAPLVLHYHGQNYFPVFKYYHPSVFGRDDISEMDYRALKISSGDWSVWPIIRWDPFERNEALTEVPSRPTRVNWLGTDEGGRDVAARLLYGFRYSIAYAFAVWAFSSLIGMLAGAVMGYAGGWTDLAGQRVIEILDSLPYLMILITLVSIFKPSLLLLVILTVFFAWVSISVYFRAEFLKLRRLEFVDEARALGASHWRLITRHLLPNSLTPWITISPFVIAAEVTGLAALDFLGYGLAAPTPSWGELLNEALKNFRIAWWLPVYPSLALFITLTVLNLIGEGVRDALDPR
jgi:microcin C transport system permease protein